MNDRWSTTKRFSTHRIRVWVWTFSNGRRWPQVPCAWVFARKSSQATRWSHVLLRLIFFRSCSCKGFQYCVFPTDRGGRCARIVSGRLCAQSDQSGRGLVLRRAPFLGPCRAQFPGAVSRLQLQRGTQPVVEQVCTRRPDEMMQAATAQTASQPEVDPLEISALRG
jgi:hypothetical protein